MSDDIQNQETLKEYCLNKYKELLNQIVVYTIAERGIGKKKQKEE